MLEAGFNEDCYYGEESWCEEFTLEDGQRLVSVKSKLYEDESERPRMKDLVFVIGWVK